VLPGLLEHGDAAKPPPGDRPELVRGAEQPRGALGLLAPRGEPGKRLDRVRRPEHVAKRVPGGQRLVQCLGGGGLPAGTPDERDPGDQVQEPADPPLRARLAPHGCAGFLFAARVLAEQGEAALAAGDGLVGVSGELVQQRELGHKLEHPGRRPAVGSP
jgi:hypothetical protein